MGFDDILEGLKQFYFSLEDGYYDFLDKVDEKFPVYSVIDPIDRFFPSFVLVFLLFLGIIFGLALVGLGFLSNANQGAFIASLKVVDNQGASLSGFKVSFLPEGASTFVIGRTTSAGVVQVQLKKSVESVRVQIKEPNFKEFDETVSLSAGTPKLVVLFPDLASSANLAATYLLKFKDKGTGLLISSQTLAVSFLCEDRNQVVGPKTTSSGKVEVNKTAECGTLYASVQPSHSYLPLSNVPVTKTPQDFLLVPLAVQSSGMLAVKVTNGSNQPVTGARLTVSTASEPSVQELVSNSQGRAVFELAAGTYAVTAFMESDGRLATKSIAIVGGQTTDVNLNIGNPPLVAKKILVKLVDQNTGQSVSQANVKFYKNNLLLSSKSSDLNGFAEQAVVVLAGDVFSAVVFHASYLLKAVPNIVPKDSSDSSPLIIQLQPRQTDPKNFGEALAIISSLEEPFVSDSRVYLYRTGFVNPLMGPFLSNDSGEALFSNLPALDSNGKYFVFAIKDGAMGTSVQKIVPIGQRINFPVQLEDLNGSFRLTVLDLNSSEPIADATVRAYAVLDGNNELLQTGQTDSQGEWTTDSFSVNRMVFFEVSKAGYLDHTTAENQVVANQTTELAPIFLSPLGFDSNAEIFLAFNQLLDDAGEPAQVMEAGKRYWAVFSLGLSEGGEYLLPVGHFEAGKQELLLVFENPLAIKNAVVPLENLQSIIFSQMLDPSDPFSNPPPLVGSETPAKQANISWSALGQGTYEIRVAFDTNQNAQDGTEIFLYFHSKARFADWNIFSGLSFKRFVIGEAACQLNCNSLYWQFLYSPKDQNQFVEVTADPVPILNNNSEYDLQYKLYNLSSQPFSNAALSFSSLGGEIEIVSDNGFANQTVPPGRFSYGVLHPARLQTLFATSQSILNGIFSADEEITDGSNEPAIAFEISGQNQLHVSYSLDPNFPHNLSITVLNAVTLEPVEDAVVKIQKACAPDINAFQFNPLDSSYQTGITDADGKTDFSNYAIGPQECAVVQASKEDFASARISILGGTPPTQSAGLYCIQIDANPATPEVDLLFDQARRNHSYEIKVISNNCPDTRISLHSLDATIGDLIDPSTEIVFSGNGFDPTDFVLHSNETKTVSVAVLPASPLGYIPIIAFVAKPGDSFSQTYSSFAEFVVVPHVAPANQPSNLDGFGIVGEP
ncbi:MAG: carboxypeptidase regulatory-like domain-containing protein [Candidatus Micrarchaeota archaeon]